MPQERLPLSASTLLIGINSSYTTIHTNTGAAQSFDDLYMTIHNATAGAITIEMAQVIGGTTTTLDINVSIPPAAQGTFFALGYPIPSGVTVVARCSSAFNLRATGYAIRNTP